MKEKDLHRQVCQYIRLQYPDVLFNSDLSGSMRLTIGQAKAMKSLRSNKGWPDLFIVESKGKYHGLFIELKIEGTNIIAPRKTDRFGNPCYATEHIAEQAEMINELRKRGYSAVFACGWDEAKESIDKYMTL